MAPVENNLNRSLSAPLACYANLVIDDAKKHQKTFVSVGTQTDNFESHTFRPVARMPLTPPATPTFEGQRQVNQGDSFQMSENKIDRQIALINALPTPPPSPEPARYPLDLRDIQLIESPTNSLAAEAEPYSAEASKPHSKPNLLERVFELATSSLFWVSYSLLHRVRSSFYQTEKELLYALLDENQQVRVSRSLLFGDYRERLYGTSNGIIDSIFVNWPKIFWQEKIPRTSSANTLALLEVVPRVIQEHFSLYVVRASREIASLVRKGATVLNDPSYDNEVYLDKLIDEMNDYVNHLVIFASPFLVKKNDHVKPSFEKVKIALNKLIENNFPTGGTMLDRERDRLDFRKVNMDRAFKYPSDLAKKVVELQSKIIDASRKMPRKTIEDKLAIIHFILGLLLELRSDANNSAENLEHFLQTAEKFQTSD